MDAAAIVDLARAPRPALHRWLALYEREWRQRLWWNRTLVPRADAPPPEGRCLVAAGEVIGGYLRTGSSRAPILEGPHVVAEWRGRGGVSRLAADAALNSGRPVTEVMSIAFEAEDAGPSFVAAGFGWLRREYRMRERSAAGPADRPRAAGPARLVPWPATGAELGAVLHAAFRDTIDGQSSRLYRSPTRCALYLDRFLRGGEGAVFAPRSRGSRSTTPGGRSGCSPPA